MRRQTNLFFGLVALIIGGCANLPMSGYQRLSGEPYYWQGIAFYEEGNYEASILELEKHLRLNPADEVATEYLNHAKVKLGRDQAYGEPDSLDSTRGGFQSR